MNTKKNKISNHIFRNNRKSNNPTILLQFLGNSDKNVDIKSSYCEGTTHYSAFSRSFIHLQKPLSTKSLLSPSKVPWGHQESSESKRSPWVHQKSLSPQNDPWCKSDLNSLGYSFLKTTTLHIRLWSITAILWGLSKIMVKEVVNCCC